MKYLDETGLSHFWNKIKETIPDDYISNNLDTILDCNNTTLESGFYYCVGETANAPFNNSAWFLQVMKELVEGKLLIITQVAYRYRDNEIWIRQYNDVSSTGWKEWSQVYPSGIIESGSNSNGNYIKYADGTMECYKSMTVTTSLETKWGNLYESPKIELGSFPVTFSGKPTITVTKTTGRGCFIQLIEGTTTSSIGYIYLGSADTFSSKSIGFDIRAIGKWK